MSTEPLRFVLGEFDNAIEVCHPGKEFPSLVISSSGGYLTGNGDKPPTARRERGVTPAPVTGAVTQREIQDEAVTEQALADNAVSYRTLDDEMRGRILPAGRNPFLRSDHEGEQSLDTTTDGEKRLALTPAQRAKLSGIATGATNNQPDDFLLDRENHTGRIEAAQINGLGAAASADVIISPQLNGKGLPTAEAVKGYVAESVRSVSTALQQYQVRTDNIALKAITEDLIATRVIRNEHIAEDAEISLSALVVNPLARGLHTGTQPATTITGLGPLATLNVPALERAVAKGSESAAALLQLLKDLSDV